MHVWQSKPACCQRRAWCTWPIGKATSSTGWPRPAPWARRWTGSFAQLITASCLASRRSCGTALLKRICLANYGFICQRAKGKRHAKWCSNFPSTSHPAPRWNACCCCKLQEKPEHASHIDVLADNRLTTSAAVLSIHVCFNAIIARTHGRREPVKFPLRLAGLTGGAKVI